MESKDDLESKGDLESTGDLTKPCSVCSKQISKQAQSCPNCGQNFVSWHNPETDELEWLTPAEHKEKPPEKNETLIGCISLVICIPIAFWIWNLLGAIGC